MGWKNVKEYYKIRHIVQVAPNNEIRIGSAYISDLLNISPPNTIHWGALGASDNAELQCLYISMSADLDKLRELIEAPDQFTGIFPVWTFDDGEVIELLCEKFGWPNCTTDGRLMYNNRFFRTREEALVAAKRDIECEIRFLTDKIASMQKEHARLSASLDNARAKYTKLEASQKG